MNQKTPINYFYVNFIIGGFVIITLTALILFVVNVSKRQIYFLPYIYTYIDIY